MTQLTKKSALRIWRTPEGRVQAQRILANYDDDTLRRWVLIGPFSKDHTATAAAEVELERRMAVPA